MTGVALCPAVFCKKSRLRCAWTYGEMTEWTKVLAWKAGVPQKGTEGSNPSLSAQVLFPKKLRYLWRNSTAKPALKNAKPYKF